MIRSIPMHIRMLCVGGIYVCVLAGVASAQLTEEQARREAREQTAAALHSTATQFLGTQRREDLERLFEAATRKPTRTILMYEVSNEGDEVRGSTVIHHLSSDAPMTFIVAVLAVRGTTFRIGGFADSLSEFNRLMADNQIRVLDSEHAQSLANFYFAVNPEKIQVNLLKSPLDLKQAVERQCHAGGRDFAYLDKEFGKWWTSHRSAIIGTEFATRVSSAPGVFRVQILTLSSPTAKQTCDASPVEATLEVSDAGAVKPVSFKKLNK